MPDYRYFTVEPVTGTPVMELPLYGVYLDKILNGAGNFTGTYRLDQDIVPSWLLLSGTTPGRYGLVCTRNDVPIWGGMLWTRTYQSGSATVQLTARTWESVFEKIVLLTDHVYQNIDVVTIFTNWLNAVQTQSSAINNFNFVISPAFGTIGVNRTVLVPGYDWTYSTTVLEQVIGADNPGLSYTVNLATTGTADVMQKQIQLHNNASPTDSGALYDYPGAISKFWLNESGQSCVGHIALGAGSGPTRLKATADNADLLSAGWPKLWEREEFPDIGDQNVLQARVNGMRDVNKPPMIRPTFEIGPEGNFVGWNDCGKLFSVYLEDPRFPTGATIQARMIGWSLNPETSGEAEVIRIQLEEGL